MNYLFICGRNKWRSRTAETIFKNNGLHQVKSAGTEPSARIKVSEKDFLWADLVFVMEQKHLDRLRQNFASSIKEKQIVLLHIPDDYKYMDDELIELLKSGVESYI